MSAVATSSTLARGVGFYRTTVGKKAVMAVTGVLLFGFLIGHMAGNLQFFLGREVLNAYAEKLHALGPLLWLVRLGLLAMAVLHIVASVQLARLQRAARPVGYSRLSAQCSSYASRTMYWSGPIVLFFLIYHLLHLTTGTAHPAFESLNAYDNVVIGFKRPLTTLFYCVSMVLLGLHLNHGLWSMFQSLGFSHPRYTPKLRALARVFSLFLVLGFLAVPIAVLAGFHPDFNRV
ncbi:MAG TPA: succinate dehydrogenase cytochrome b subunit [Bryobacteraceae bacterium]|nr:succinate dehydrogenase cytochrome b subunit [Bryobacteraceae bacterium]